MIKFPSAPWTKKTSLHTLGPARARPSAPLDQFGLSSSKIGGTCVKQHSELGQPGRYRRADRGMSSPPKLE